ncbi:MAG: hypothetical protein JSV74_01520, partial [Dehalococcoidia bacterium]
MKITLRILIVIVVLTYFSNFFHYARANSAIDTVELIDAPQSLPTISILIEETVGVSVSSQVPSSES